MMNVGDLVWVDFPPGAGCAQAGRRPAIIAQTATASDRLPTVLLIPLTTQQDALRFPGTVLVEPDRSNGLRLVSVALAFQLTSVDRRFLGPKFGAILPTNMEAIWGALHEIMGR